MARVPCDLRILHCLLCHGTALILGTAENRIQERYDAWPSRHGRRCITVHPGRHDPHLRVIPAWVIHHGYGTIRTSDSLQPLRDRAWPRRECRPAREHHGYL